MVALCLTFGKIARLLSKAPAGKPTLYLPPSVKCVLVLVPQIMQTVIVCLFDYSLPSENEVIPHCGFDLHFPNG